MGFFLVLTNYIEALTWTSTFLHLQNTRNSLGFIYAFQKLSITEAMKQQQSFKELEHINIIKSVE